MPSNKTNSTIASARVDTLKQWAGDSIQPIGRVLACGGSGKSG